MIITLPDTIGETVARACFRSRKRHTFRWYLTPNGRDHFFNGSLRDLKREIEARTGTAPARDSGEVWYTNIDTGVLVCCAEWHFFGDGEHVVAQWISTERP